MKVLYIGGLGRSGSTLLGNILNEVDGFFHAGELCYVWKHCLLDNYCCGCGAEFRSCTLWHEIFERAFGGTEKVKGYRIHRPGNKAVTLQLLGIDRHSPLAAEQDLEMIEQLYTAIFDVVGCRVLIDSSKIPAYAYLLQQIPSIDLKILHLVRDPRGVAYSWQKKVVREDVRISSQVIMPRFTTRITSLRWVLWNSVMELMKYRSSAPYMRIRYEDFIESPAEYMSCILAFIDESSTKIQSIRGKQVDLGGNHMCVGNPSRSRIGEVYLKQDTKWRKELRFRDQIMVGLLCWPLMVRYGYTP